MPEKIIPVFTHIPKTAGTTLNRIMEWQYLFKPGTSYHTSDIFYLTRFNNLSLKEKKKIKLMKGHFSYGIHEHCPFPVCYFTMLRQPEKRSISHYYHMLRWYKYYPRFKNQQLEKYSLKDFLEKGLVVAMDNCHVRYLCGVPNIPYGAVNEEHMRIAIDNLKKWYSVIGITEFFDESILLFAKELNWSQPYYVKSNVSPPKTSKVEIDDETQALLKYYNRYDDVLYKIAVEIFNEQIARAGSGFKDEVAAFVEKNKQKKLSTIAITQVTKKLWWFNKYNLRDMKRYITKYLKTKIS